MSGARRSPDRPLNTNRGVPERFFPDILADEAQATLPNKRQRRPRNTMGEEVAGDLIFIRMKPPADEAIAGPSQPAADRSRRRNEVARSRPPVSRVRRDSMSVKGLRRVSSLRDGAPAYPHDDIPDDVLYKHCSDQVPPVVRMKHLLNWTLHRSIPQALAEAPPPRIGRRRRHGKIHPGDDADLSLLSPIPPEASRELTEQDRQHVAEVSPILLKLMQDTLRDLNDGLIGISWLRHAKKDESRPLQPHPRNESNRHAEQQLSGMLEQLRNELTSWKEHEFAIQRIDEESEAVEAMATQLREQITTRRRSRAQSDESAFNSADGDEEQALADEVERARMGAHGTDASALSWAWEDADEDAQRQLDLAQSVLVSTESLNHAVASQTSSDIARDTSLDGTEVDARLHTLEYDVDKIHRRLHAVAQLDELSNEYIRRVSSRAAQALHERTSAGLASFSDSLADATSGADLASSATAQRRLDTLLANVRDTNDPSTHQSIESPAVLPTDSHQLLRALARDSGK